jgi:hypothetical protein
MPDFPQDFQPLDPGRINADDPVEFAFWCWTLRCNEQHLLQLIAQVGPHVTQVRALLATPQGATPPDVPR